MHLKNVLSAIALFTVCVGTTQSSPVYYGFQGTINQTASLVDNPYAVGGKIKLTFLVDRDLPAYGVDETTHEIYPIESTISSESFFAQWVGGNVTQQEPAVDFPFSYYFGYQSGPSSLLIGSNTNVAGADEIHVTNNTVNIADWTLGMSAFEGEHLMMIGSSYLSLAKFDLTLTSISNVAPDLSGVAAIPEPEPLAMLGLGMLLLGVSTRRRSTRNRIL